MDATCIANGRGYGRFARELIAAMAERSPADEFVLFVDDRAAAAWTGTTANARLALVPQRVSPTVAAAADSSRSPGDMLRFTRAVWRARLDVFFSPSVYTYFPLPPRLAAVVTLHDAIAERFPEMTLPSRRARLFWNLKTRLALMQARLVLTVSEFAASEIIAVHGLSRDRIRVASEAPSSIYKPSECAADIEAVARKYGVRDGERWFVYVGGFNPHKHVDMIVRAHAAAIRGAEHPPRLLLVGTRDSDVFHGDSPRITDAIRQCGTTELVHWTGFIPDDELRHILSGAIALLLPSESEGFGLPAIEAAACGTPAIATTASPLPDLLKDGGYFVDPGDELATARAMIALMTDENDRIARGTRAREGSSRLSWTAAADVALSALREAAA